MLDYSLGVERDELTSGSKAENGIYIPQMGIIRRPDRPKTKQEIFNIKSKLSVVELK